MVVHGTEVINHSIIFFFFNVDTSIFSILTIINIELFAVLESQIIVKHNIIQFNGII